MGGKGVPKRVRACRFGYRRFLYGLFHRTLQHAFVKMMSALLASNSIGVVLGSGKNPLPCPFSTRVRIFTFQSIRQCDATEPFFDIFLMLASNRRDMSEKGFP